MTGNSVQGKEQSPFTLGKIAARNFPPEGNAERKNTGESQAASFKSQEGNAERKNTAAVTSSGRGVRMGTEWYG